MASPKCGIFTIYAFLYSKIIHKINKLMAGVIRRYWATTGITTLLQSAPNPVSITADIGKANWCGEMIIIGFDSEWVYLPVENRNHILSYQFTVLTASSECSGIVYTEGPELKHRWKLSDLLGHAIQVAREQKVLGWAWPQEVCAAAHFTRADLAAFRDYGTLRTEFDNLRGSFSTITKPYECTFYDSGRHARKLKVHLVDTMAIAPGGTSLAAVGDLHKRLIPDTPVLPDLVMWREARDRT